ncbi:hypothetical protein J6590_084048 [Homalodisca vitripennis]|nr:hypothetical protein J6590_084048 [Homalodisca vitripennis]
MLTNTRRESQYRLDRVRATYARQSSLGIDRYADEPSRVFFALLFISQMILKSNADSAMLLSPVEPFIMYIPDCIHAFSCLTEILKKKNTTSEQCRLNHNCQQLLECL